MTELGLSLQIDALERKIQELTGEWIALNDALNANVAAFHAEERAHAKLRKAADQFRSAAVVYICETSKDKVETPAYHMAAITLAALDELLIREDLRLLHEETKADG